MNAFSVRFVDHAGRVIGALSTMILHKFVLALFTVGVTAPKTYSRLVENVKKHVEPTF